MNMRAASQFGTGYKGSFREGSYGVKILDHNLQWPLTVGPSPPIPIPILCICSMYPLYVYPVVSSFQETVRFEAIVLFCKLHDFED